MRIAIYSRKSKFTGAGESIENQIELCTEYAKRNLPGPHEFFVFEDEGFSGKNTARPEFQRMLSALRDNRFEALVCYRLDRISRSVSDFSLILEELEQRDIAFVSIRESFDTSTPMGRAMIHIASVFSQLERETIAERIRDNKYRLYRTGRWQGGTPPFGFLPVKTTLLDEAGSRRSCYHLQPMLEKQELIHAIFEGYLRFHSFAELSRQLTKSHDVTLSASALRGIIKNPVYATNDKATYRYFAQNGSLIANCKEEFDGKHGLIAYHKTSADAGKNAVRKRCSLSGWIISVSEYAGFIPGKQWVLAQQVQQNRRKNV